MSIFSLLTPKVLLCFDLLYINVIHMEELTEAFRNFDYATNYEVIKRRDLGEWEM